MVVSFILPARVQSQDGTPIARVGTAPTSRAASRPSPASASGIVSVDLAIPFSGGTGELRGTFMHNGKPAPYQWVALHPTRPVAGANRSGKAFRAMTDADGKFSFTLSSPGLHALQAVDQVVHCRVWPSHQAPPSAVQQVLLACDSEPVVRGQIKDLLPCARCKAPNQTGFNGGFQKCDADCARPPILTNCNTCGWFGCKCGKCASCGCCECDGGFLGQGSRSKLLVAALGVAVIVYALDDDDSPIDIEPSS